MTRAFPWADRMIGCPHDLVYHAEGDPWVHTCMVADTLEADDGFPELDPHRRHALRLAAWFHDIAKPHTTVVEWCAREGRERVRQPNHAPMGARMAWQALLDAGAAPELARDVHGLVFWHQRPGHMPEQKNTTRRILLFASQVTGVTWSDLLRLCRSDQMGRISPNVAEGLETLQLAEMMVREEGEGAGVDLLRNPWPFASAEARLRYFGGKPDASPWYTPPQDDRQPRMALMSGLPGAGKNSLIEEHLPGLPVVELDAIRRGLGIPPDGNQGQVIQAAIEAARGYLRKGQSFVWNATCLSVQARQKPVSLARDYGFAVDAYSFDIPLAVARARNAARPDPVPEGVMDRMAMRREPVGVEEASRIHSVDIEGRITCLIGDPALSQAPDVCPAP